MLNYLVFKIISAFCISVFLCVVSHASAKDIEITGRLIQGGLLFGKVSPGVKIKILKKDVHVDNQGNFVFGLGRDADSQLVIEHKDAEGETRLFEYEVEQREYNLQKIEGVAQKYVSPPEAVLARIKSENQQVAKARATFSDAAHFKSGFELPAKGPITGVFGSQRVFNGVPKRPHYGLDIAGPEGAPVQAPAAGRVTLVHDDMYYSGGTLIIDHGQGVSSTFIHLSKIHVKEGEIVSAGALIAEIGATGRVTGPHLDWRVNWFEQRLDPQLLIGISN